MSTTVVGISAYYHDAACCLLRDGQLIAAAEEERFTRIKHDLLYRYAGSILPEASRHVRI